MFTFSICENEWTLVYVCSTIYALCHQGLIGSVRNIYLNILGCSDLIKCHISHKIAATDLKHQRKQTLLVLLVLLVLRIDYKTENGSIVWRVSFTAEGVQGFATFRIKINDRSALPISEKT